MPSQNEPKQDCASEDDSNKIYVPDCCDMRGFLSFQILWELGKRPMNGQELAHEIAKRRGSKPTPGTIYPALKELERKELIQKINDMKDKRLKVYRLTETGKQGRDEAGRYFFQVFEEIIEEYMTNSK